MKKMIVMGSKYTRMVVCSLTAVLCIGDTWGRGVNPAYKKWILRQCDPDRQIVSTNSEKTVNKPSKRLLATPGEIVSVNDVTGLERLSTEDNFGYKPSLIDYSYLSVVNIRSPRLNSSESLPKQYDSRDNGWITTVKDQNPFGTCWAHAAIGAVEAAVRREHPNSYSNNAQPDFSENNMVMQNWHDVHPYGQKDYITGQPSAYSAGGFFETAFAYLGRWGGPILESEDPYPTAANSYSTHGNDIVKPSAFNVTGYIKYAPKTSALDHDEIKRAIMKYGGVWVSYCATESENVNDGSGTIYTFPYISSDRKSFYNWCSQVFGEKNGSNHAVLLVGWDDNYSRDNFVFYSAPSKYRMPVPPGDGAYLIKNSWGTGQFDNGYLWVSYYDDNMLYDDSYAIPIVESTDNYSEIYQYDPLGLVYQFPDSSYQWGANIFTATDNANLTAVGFYSMAPQTSYTIKVYTGVSSVNPISGTCQTGNGKVGTVADAGFAMVKLDNPVSLTKGERFSVVLKLESPGCDEPFGSEVNLIYKTDWWSKYKSLKHFSYSLTSRATAEPGQSFVSKNGASGTWRDITTDISPITVEKEGYFLTINGQNIYDEVLYDTSSANLCIKAYTEAGNPTTELTGIEIYGDKTSITSGGTVSLSCTASYNNVSPKDVTNIAAWSIVAGKGDDVAEVVAPGVIKTSSTFETKLVSVLATYEEDGVSKSDTWDFYVTIAAPSVPTGVAASQGTESSCVRVNWTAPIGATEYAVYRATANNSNNAQYLDKVTVAKYNDTSAVPGANYWYFIKSRNSSGTSEFSAGAVGWRKLAPPENVTATVDLMDKVSITWSKVDGAFYYQVYRADSEDASPKSISPKMVKCNYDDASAEAGKQYYYYVLAMTDSSNSRNSGLGDSVIGKRAVPVTIDYLELKGNPSIAAGEHADYTADAVYTDTHKVEGIVPDTWTVTLGGEWATVSSGRVTAAMVPENKTVVLKASYTDGGKTAHGEKEITVAATKPAAPMWALLDDVTADGIIIRWSAVAGAASYKVYRDDVLLGTHPVGGSFDTTYTDKTAIPGVTYSYSVSAVNGAGEGPRSSPAVTAVIPLPLPTGVTATSDRTDGVSVLWSAVNGATHYRVARAESEDGEKTEIGTWTKDLTHLDTTAPVDAPMWYFVRAATSSSGDSASDWSDGVVGRRVSTPPQLISLVIFGPDRVPASGTAIYSCTAEYDDNSSVSVTPTWSVAPSSAATIDDYGCLVAAAISADMNVTITATFDGTPASKSVKIVAPLPIGNKASATVSNVRVKPRWPFSTLVDIDYTLVTEPEGTMAHITLSGQDDDHNVPLAARTLTGDGASAVVAAGERRITWDIGADHPGLHVKSFDVNIEAVPYVITAPANLTATQGTSSRGVNLSWDVVENATGYEIWRSDSPVSATASNIVFVSEGTTYLDVDSEAMRPYFYWVKTVTEYGTSDFGNYVYGYRMQPVAGSIAIDPNGGTANMESMPYTVGEPYGTLPVAERTGHSFVGWFTAREGGALVTAETIASDQIATLFAHWTPNSYVVRFNANGGTGTMADMQVSFGVATNLAANVYTMAGCQFAGWATNETGSILYTDRATVTPTANLALYAQWTIPLHYALDNDGFSFNTGGDAEWLGVSDSSAVNGSAARSGKITHAQSTWLRTTVSGKGELSFRCKTSCESSFDKLTLSIDGRQYGTASGTGNGYNTLSYSVTNSGTHTVAWTYSKDSSVSQGDDCVWIDQIEWTPMLFSASSGTSTDGIELEWVTLENATAYLIWRSTTTNRADATVLDTATPATTRYTDTSATPGVMYNYWLQVLTSLGSVTDIGGMVSGWRNFTAPTNFTASQGTYTNYVWLTFDAPTGANFYEFYMSQANILSSAHSIGYVASEGNPLNVVVSDGIEPGTNYYFWVRACYAVPNSTWYTIIGRGEFSESAMGYIKKFYAISFNANGGEGDMAQQDVLIGATTNLMANAFSRAGYVFQGWATNVNSAVVYADGASIAPVADMALYAVWDAMAPAWVSATDGTSSNEVTVTWAPVASATSYEVWRGTTTDPSAAMRLTTLSGTSYLDSSALGGTRYYYWIKSICNGVKSEFSTAYDGGWRKMYTPAPTFKGNCGSVTNIVISWTSISGATKYQIYRSTSKSSLGSLIAEPETTSYTDASISVNIYYYYSVRAVGSIATTSASSEFGKVKAYAGTYPHDSSFDVSSLRSVLTRVGHNTPKTYNLSGSTITMNNYGITNDEIGQAMTTPSKVDLDGNVSTISAKEQLVFGCIYDCWQKGCISGGANWSVASSDEARYKCEKLNDFIVGLSDGTATCRTLEVSTNLVTSTTNTGVRVVYNRSSAASQAASTFVLVYRTDVLYPIGIMNYERLNNTGATGSSSLADLLAQISGQLNKSYGYVFTDETAISGRTYTYYVRVYSYEYGISPKSKNVTGKR